MELLVWKGDWGLPSVDFRCISVMAYCKFSGAPVKIVNTANPWRTLAGDLPVLRYEGGRLTDVADMFHHLRKQKWGTDYDLTSKQSADLVALTAMLEEKLEPAWDHCFWIDSKNFVEFTRPWYVNAMRFPLSMIVPNRKHKLLVDKLYYCKGAEYVTDREREYLIYKDAKECLNALSIALGDKDYFFGRTPSSFDALVFGYLAPLLKAPLPSAALPNHLKACENLCAFCRRILHKYYPMTPEEEAQLRQAEEKQRQQKMEETDFPNRTRNIIFAALSAFSAMVIYAFMSGLIQIQFEDDDDDNEITFRRQRNENRSKFRQFENNEENEQSQNS